MAVWEGVWFAQACEFSNWLVETDAINVFRYHSRTRRILLWMLSLATLFKVVLVQEVALFAIPPKKGMV